MFSPNGVSSTAFWYPWYYSIPTTITVVRWPLPFTEPFVDLFDALPNLITVPLLQKCKVGYFSSTVYWKNFCFLTYIFAFYSLIFKYSRERIKGKLPVIYLPWFCLSYLPYDTSSRKLSNFTSKPLWRREVEEMELTNISSCRLRSEKEANRVFHLDSNSN